MIDPPAGWSLIVEAGMLELVHPGGRGVAVIEYRERVRPLERLGALVRRLVGREPPWSRAEIPTQAERLLTVEGEHAALVTLRLPAASMQRDLGFVFGDDFFALADAKCLDPDVFAEVTAVVRGLVRNDRHMLGTRRRRFDYEPPAAWQPLVEGFMTEWFPPGYPQDSAYMTVYPASPVHLPPRAVFATSLGLFSRAGLRVRELEEPRPIRADAGLEGERFRVVCERPAPEAIEITKIGVVLQDQRYSYTIEVSARSAAHLDAHAGEIDRVIASVKPVPQAGPRDNPSSTPWSD
jgi:hypothetical protein